MFAAFLKSAHVIVMINDDRCCLQGSDKDYIPPYLGEEEVYTVQEAINCGETRRKKRLPPPTIVLGAKMTNGPQNCDQGTGHDEDDRDKEEKAEKVKDMMGPNVVQDDEELNVDAAKGRKGARDDANQRTLVE